MDDLSTAELEQLKSTLETLLAELQAQLERGAAATAAVQLDQTLVGRVSRVDVMQQQSMAVSTRNKTRQRMQKVTAALAAVAAGDYGYCRRCDEAIGFARLHAQPEANLCIDCQDAADKR